MKVPKPWTIQESENLLFGPEDDAKVMALHARLGHRWKQIADEMAAGFTSVMVKNRVNCLLLRKANDEHAARVAMAHVEDLCAMHGLFPFPVTVETIDDFLDAFGA